MAIPRASRNVTAFLVTASIAGASLAGCERTPPSGSASAASGASTSTSAISPASDAARDATPDAARRVTAPPPSLADTVDPTATVRAYLARARMHRATRDSLIWEPPTDGTAGFRAFADSTIPTFTVASPGRVEGAAGSRYVTIPFVVEVTRGGVVRTLHGAATLRRAVVDGATAAQRRWRIMRIEWGAPVDSAPSHR